jgi:hypothetical protein
MHSFLYSRQVNCRGMILADKVAKAGTFFIPADLPGDKTKI